jgi:hypothetical protein
MCFDAKLTLINIRLNQKTLSVRATGEKGKKQADWLQSCIPKTRFSCIRSGAIQLIAVVRDAK